MVDHVFGRWQRQLVIEGGKRMDALDRMPHAWIDEHEDAIEHVAAQGECLPRHHHRLAELIACDAPRLLV